MDNLPYIKNKDEDQDELDIEEQKDLIIALFVVRFDTKKGNEIEWQIPDEVDLKGVEFQAIVSGSHTISQDFTYFRHQQHYGLSVFLLKHVENAAERGARMKSVGILCSRYTSLHQHQDFLENQVRQHLNQPGEYSDLTRYYIKYRNCPLQNNLFIGSPRAESNGVSSTLTIGSGIDNMSVMRITHPVGCFGQFIRYFGVKISVLWKFVLLQKRILFFAPPPVGSQCYRVYCSGLLGSNVMGLLRPGMLHLLFFVSVCNIHLLDSLDCFVACTTEEIFSTKKKYYDLFVNKQTLENTDNYWRPIAQVNPADKKRYTRLKKYSNEQLHTNEDITNDEKMYTRFFVEQNNRLFKILMEVSKRDDRQLRNSDIREMGLSPCHDRLFLSEIIDLYRLNVVNVPSSCCSCC